MQAAPGPTGRGAAAYCLLTCRGAYESSILSTATLFGGADFFLYQPYRAYPKDLRYSLGLIHPRERFRRCSQ